MHNRFQPRQTVYAKCGIEGTTQLVTSAVFIQPAGKKKLLLRHPDGHRFEAANEDVYPSKEALEATIPELRVSMDYATGRVTHFPANPALSRDDETLFEHRRAGDPSVFGRRTMDWMLLPEEILAHSPGPKKRKILREFTAPSPTTGATVRALDIEGGVRCYETPGVGWEFRAKRPTSPVAPPGTAPEAVEATFSPAAAALDQDALLPFLKKLARLFIAEGRREQIAEDPEKGVIVFMGVLDGGNVQHVFCPSDIPHMPPTLQEFVREYRGRMRPLT